VHAAAVYERAVIFREFVAAVWRGREDTLAAGNRLYNQHWKYIGNSLYGKFGQNGRVYETDGAAPVASVRNYIDYDLDTGTLYKGREFGGLRQTWRDEGESRDSMPAIAAHVTSAARVLLWQYVCAAGREQCLYADTDSLLVTRAGTDRLAEYVAPGELGALKIEMTVTGATIHGPKDYVIGTKWRTKGVRKGALWLAPGHVEQEQWASLVGLIRLGDLSAPRTWPVRKVLARGYLKGIVRPDGRVDPLRLPA